nr:MAG TPA: hypothetical protein [Caudoviricetes sp.]
MFNVLIRTIAIDLIFIIVALCVALIIYIVRHKKHKQDNNIGVCVPNRKIDKYDILAVLVGCIIGLILSAAMEAGI